MLQGTLHGLVAAQAAAGAASALLVFWIARALLRLGFGWALGAALLVALEPAQLFYERMIMAEAFGSVAWLAFVGCALAYAQRGTLPWLLGAVLAGIAGRLAAPERDPGRDRGAGAVAVAALARRGAHRARARARRGARDRRAARRLSQLRRPPRTRRLATSAWPGHSSSGWSRRWCAPSTSPAPAAQADILRRVRAPLADPWLREVQIWRGDGLWPAMQRETAASPEEAARVVADRALHADPLGLLPLALATLRQHLNAPSARWRMDSDLGRNALGKDFVATIRQRFGFNPTSVPFRDTVTSRAFDASRWWLTLAYFATPFYVAAIARRARRQRDVTALAFALVAGLLGTSQFLFSHILSFRYLHAFPVLLVLALAWLLGTRTQRAVDAVDDGFPAPDATRATDFPPAAHATGLCSAR